MQEMFTPDGMLRTPFEVMGAKDPIAEQTRVMLKDIESQFSQMTQNLPTLPMIEAPPSPLMNEKRDIPY